MENSRVTVYVGKSYQCLWYGKARELICLGYVCLGKKKKKKMLGFKIIKENQI